MSTGTQVQRPQTRTQYAPQSDTPNLDASLKETFTRITKALEAREDNIEDLLPDFMKGQGKRLIARARQYWARGDWKLKQCSEASFISCVLAAAELGFCVDGRMAHAVPFATKIKGKPGERDAWENKAQLIVDYKDARPKGSGGGIWHGRSSLLQSSLGVSFERLDGRRELGAFGQRLIRLRARLEILHAPD